MPDFTMCDREDCPSHDKCDRFAAEANPYRQSYFAPPYPEIVGGKCEYFIGRRPKYYRSHILKENLYD